MVKKIVCNYLTGEGIDYQNPAFIDEAGNSRILAIWDQTDQTGTPPEGYVFGSQYLREDINQALQAEDPGLLVPTKDQLRHGTVMAGLAAGSTDGGRKTSKNNRRSKN